MEGMNDLLLGPATPPSSPDDAPPKKQRIVGTTGVSRWLFEHPADHIPLPPAQLWNRLMWAMQQKLQKVQDQVSELGRRVSQGLKDCSDNLEKAFEEEAVIREEYREELLHDAHQDLSQEKETLDERYNDHVDHIQCEMIAIKTLIKDLDARMSSLEKSMSRREE